MAHYEPIIPSTAHYFEKYKELDETDLAIIFSMIKDCPDGPRNVQEIARHLSLPQQTVNYRVLRLDAKDLVKFRAIANEELLGLVNYAVIATVKPGLAYENKEGTAVNAGTFMTCYPVWRMLEEVRGGSTHGYFVQYSIPSGKENDLKLFLDHLIKVGCITQVDDFCRTTPSCFNTPSMDLLLEIRKATAQGHRVSFDWEAWADGFDKAQTATLPKEETSEGARITFDYKDLLVLFRLESNLREKFVDIARLVSEPSSKVAGRYKRILNSHLISGCRLEVNPVDPLSAVHLVLKMEFMNTILLRQFASRLNEMPYPAAYQKVIGKNIVFLHTMIPSYEYFDFCSTLEMLNRKRGTLRDVDLWVSSFYGRFDNIMLYKAFSNVENKWMFSKDMMLKALNNLLTNNGFKF